MPSEEERLKDIAGAICRMNVTWTLLTPSVASIIEPSMVPCLEVLVCGGEPLSPEVVSKWASSVRLINGYGPSETSVVATVNSNVSCDKNPLCIGQGITATSTWIVDPANHDRLAPLGSVGELVLEGPTLARGYLNKPRKTAEAFIENPAWAVTFSAGRPSPRRIYKTGDLVRYNPNGSLEFVGRKDSQVKLRGQRLELGDIEHCLLRDPRIRHALVLMPKSGLCQRRLVAMLSLNLFSESSGLSVDKVDILKEETRLSAARGQVAETRNFLSEQLPPYMIPHVWLIVKVIPMLASGKLDRKQAENWLENVDDETYKLIMASDSCDTGATQATGTTRVLQKICSIILDLPLENVNLNQSFRSLG